MRSEKYSDPMLLMKLQTVYVLALEAGDTYIPHDPHEWGGLDRYSAYNDMMALVVEYEEECHRRGLDYHEAEHRAELEWERKHADWG